MRVTGSLWFWRGVLGWVVLVGLGVFALHTSLPVDGTGGDVRSFTPRGYRVDWLFEPREHLLRVGDLIRRANGHDVEEWLRGEPASSDWRAGALIVYEVERDGQALTIPVPLAPVAFGALLGSAWPQLLVALSFFGVGLFAFWKRPREPAARLLLLGGTTTALRAWLDIYFQFASVAWSWLFWSHLALIHGTSAVAVASICSFTLIFPVRHPLARRFPRLLPLILYGSCPLAILAAMALASSLSAAVPAGERAVMVVIVLQAGLGLGALVRSARVAATPAARAQVRWMLWCLGLTVAVQVPTFAGPVVLTGGPLIPPPVSTILLAVVPISFAIAFLRYRLFDIELIINRTLVYGLVTALLALVYSTSTVLLQQAFVTVTGQTSDLAIVGSTLAIALLFQPLRGRVQDLIDRRFSRDRIARRRYAQEAAEALGRAQPPERVLSFLTRHTVEQLDLSAAWVVLPQPLSDFGDGLAAPPLPAPVEPLLLRLRPATGPVLLVRDEAADNGVDTLPADDAATAPWYAAGARLLLPLSTRAPERSSAEGGRGQEHSILIGIWALGTRRDGSLPGRADQAMLVQVGQRAAVLLDRARLYQDRIEQERVRRRELEQTVRERTHDLAEAVQRLKALGGVSQAVNSTLDLPQVLTTIVAYAVQLSGADAGAIYAFDPGAQVFRLRATHRMSPELLAANGATHIRPGETTVGQVAVTHEAVHVPDILEEPAHPLRELAEHAGFRAVLAVPLLREDRLLGVLVVYRTEPGRFRRAIVELVQSFAAQSVLAIQNARLFHELEGKSRRLEVASRHKSEFLASMSHELRTPLNAIIGFSEVLLKRMAGDLNERQAEYLQDVLDSGRHLLSLINDILDLSKVEAGRIELELGWFSLREVLENGLMMVRERANHHGITLALEVDPTIGELEGDARRIKQVVFNLLSNAVKFTPDGGRVDVRADRADGEVRVSVRDTGIGLASEDQERIFQAFHQAGHGPGLTQEGTGLGLTLAKQFVELHGGRLWVQSAPGAGSTFTFTFPPRRGSQEAAEQRARLLCPEGADHPPGLRGAGAAWRGAGGLTGELILIVEDNEKNLKLVREVLRCNGYRTLEARGAEEGIALARARAPDLILLDIQLPDVSGEVALRRLRAEPGTTRIPVIALTAFAMKDDRKRFLGAGFDDYVVKPIDTRQFPEQIRRHCERAHREEAERGAATEDPRRRRHAH